MTDLRPTIVPKSDQLNADDLIGGRTLTVTITKVSLLGEADQPIAVHFEGDNGKPYKPCKSMRRVMVQVWGSDGNDFVGNRMTLYRDETVQFGGERVGGIRISHMSGIDRDVVLALTTTRAKRKPYTVKPLPANAGQRRSAREEPPADAIRTGAPPAADQRRLGQAEPDEPAGADDPRDWATTFLSEVESMTLAETERALKDPANIAKFGALAEQFPALADELNRSITRHQKVLRDEAARG